MAAAAAAACGPACTSTAGSTASSSRAYTGTIDGLRKIVRQEGMRVLWRGTDVALMMAVPMVGIYLPLYDFLLLRLQQQLQQLAAQQGQGQGQGQQYPIGGGAWAPLVAGTLARTAAVFCTAPFELARTRLQAGHAQPATASAAASAVSGGGSRTALLLQHMPSREGGSRLRAAGRMWTGVGATLARDVPFSALYWGMVEPIRGALLPPRAADAARLSEWEVFAANVTGEAGGRQLPWPACCLLLRVGRPCLVLATGLSVSLQY
jgi:solute carrier family 25 protein 39/40